MRIFLIAVVATATILQTKASIAEEINKKRGLIVQITIDQFRADYLDRLRPALKRGFHHIIQNGTVVEKGEVDHAITNSYPGHFTLSTGAYPANHGFPANEWWDFIDGKWTWVDGGIDPRTTILGSNNREGYSPSGLNVTTLGDWVKKADSKAKSVSLSSNSTAISYAGKTGNHVYWYERDEGEFVTSSYYTSSYPQWIVDFNQKTLPKFKTEEWTLSVPESYLSLVDSDDQSFEDFGKHYTFPHRFNDEYDSKNEKSRKQQLDDWFYEIPHSDLAVLELAKTATENEKLGQRESIDYLALSLGATDNIGHIYGGYSVEILDTMFLIDQAVGDLIMFLDKSVGKDNYTLVISGDHGAPDLIERRLENKQTAFRIPQENIENLLDRIDEMGNLHKGARSALTEKIEALIEKEPYVEDAVTEAEVFGQQPSENPYINLYRNSWVRGRVPDFPLWTKTKNRIHHPARYGIYVQYKENTHFGYGVVVHGSPYPYDREVPILFYGNKVKKQKIKNVRTIDVAPTLAALMGIPFSGSVDGKALF